MLRVLFRPFFSLLLLGCCFSSTTVQAQDRIHLKDSTTLEVNIFRIDKKVIRYRLYQSKDQRVYSVPKSRIQRVVTQQGGILTFDNIKEQVPIELRNRSFVSLNIGASLPIRDYGSNEFRVTSGALSVFSDAGFAQPGLLYQFEGVYHINSYKSIGFAAGRFVNAQEEEAFERAIRISLSNTTDDIVEVTSGSWENNYVMGGLYISKPVDVVFIDLKAYLGAIISTEPEFRITGVDTSGNSLVIFNDPATAVDFVLNFGIGVRVPIHEHWAIRMMGEFLVSRPTFNSAIFNEVNGSIENQTSGSFQQRIGVANLGIGLVYHLGS